MKKKLLQTLSLGLAVVAITENSLPVFAYEVDENGNSIESIEYQNNEDEDFTNNTNVFAEIGSEYKVTIPKVVVLSGASKAASYYVKVTGDIAGYEKINVVPDNNFKLFATGKNSQEATINQDKITWRVSDFDADAVGKIEANGITAGKWTGAFNFNINLETEKVAGDIVIEEPVQILAAGLYDENNNLIKSWDELIAMGLDIEKEYTSSTYKTDLSSGYSVFTNNNLSGKLVIPNTITEIKNWSFAGCKSITEIIIPNSVTSIGNMAFQFCSSLYSVTIPDSVINIGSNAFCECNSLVTITIPSTVANIGSDAFSKCESLTEINVNENNQNFLSIDGIVFTKDKKTLVVYPYGKSNNTYIIPNFVENIGESAFSRSKNLIEIIIPNSVTSIEKFAFSNCTSLESITIPDSVTSIENSTFNGCISLTSVTIPNSVTNINTNAFYGCTSLESIIIPDSVTNIGSMAFVNCSSLTSVTIPNSVTKIGTLAFGNCKNLSSITYRGTAYTNKTTLNNKVKTDGVASMAIWQ